MRHFFEFFSHGICMARGTGLGDPCEENFPNIFTYLSMQDMEDVMSSAQVYLVNIILFFCQTKHFIYSTRYGWLPCDSWTKFSVWMPTKCTGNVWMRNNWPVDFRRKTTPNRWQTIQSIHLSIHSLPLERWKLYWNENVPPIQVASQTKQSNYRRTYIFFLFFLYSLDFAVQKKHLFWRGINFGNQFCKYLWFSDFWKKIFWLKKIGL